MRVSIARALCLRPKLLLMDEPFAALDEITRFKLNDDLLRLQRELGCTVVFVTHSVYESVYLSTRIVVMAARPGRVVAEIQVDAPRRARRDVSARVPPMRNSAGARAQALHGAMTPDRAPMSDALSADRRVDAARRAAPFDWNRVLKVGAARSSSSRSRSGPGKPMSTRNSRSRPISCPLRARSGRRSSRTGRSSSRRSSSPSRRRSSACASRSRAASRSRCCSACRGSSSTRSIPMPSCCR